MSSKVLLLSVVFSALVVVLHAQTSATTPPSQEDICNRQNGTSCRNCTSVGGAGVEFRCSWCGATKRCSAFNFNTLIPVRGVECPQLRYNLATCALDTLAIIIIIAVACLLFVVLVCCCCCCCCIACANRRRRMKVIEENRYADEKDSIRQKSAERRAERKAKHDEIRRKYGLNSDEGTDGNYKRF